MADAPGGIDNDHAGPGLLRHCTDPTRRLYTKVNEKVQHLPPTALCTAVASTLAATWSMALPNDVAERANLAESPEEETPIRGEGPPPPL